jgi:hypothetical protein
MKAADHIDTCDRHSLALDLNSFAWEALEEQSVELGVSVEELVTFAALYYLADLDSMRIARELPPDPRLQIDHAQPEPVD